MEALDRSVGVEDEPSSRGVVSTRFEVVGPLGEGGMGVVYEAIDHERNSRVALKTLRRFSPEGLARFKREFRALEGIHHPNLVNLGELVCEGDQWFFTMELLDGVDFIRYVRPWHRDLSSAPPADESSRCFGPPETTLDAPVRRASMAPPPEKPPTLPPPSGLEAPTFDEERLRAALADLARGLLALHDAQRVHRDVKPSNIRVTADGRVVLLDFGLVGEMDPERSEGGLTGGTPAYMAPEQAGADPATPAADWYSVGAILYEALTGRVPFEGDAPFVMAQKERVDPMPPSALVRDIPADLESLCLDLLKRDPAHRLAGRDMLQRLGERSARAAAPQLPPSWSGRAVIVGRDRELATLEKAFDASAKASVALAVHGRSGIGKTWLVRAFAERLVAADPQVLVLHGRCHEREAVPYKALDDVVDLLSQRLERSPEEEVRALTPPHIGALLYVFPVLRSVAVFATAAEKHTDVQSLDPSELRRRAFIALRDLFGRLGRWRRTIVVVDDLQWADADSFLALSTLLRPPDPPPIFFVATVRTPLDTPSGMPNAIMESLPSDVRLIHVGPLPEAEARALAAKRVGADGAPSGSLPAAIAAEAEGHPLFIDELARAAAAGRTPTVLKLDDALWSRVAHLDPEEQLVTEIVAIAAAPLPQDTVARAAGLEPRVFAKVASGLRAANLVRSGGVRASDWIEPYHDRVREAVVAHLGAEDKRALHARLATAIESGRTRDDEALAVHWREAGDAPRAKKHAVAAAEQAWSTLAFDRAAQWYEMALELAPDREADRPLRVRLGESLGSAGRGALAASQYEQAAIGAERYEAIDLQRRAAEQLFRSGHFDEGLAIARSVLALIGVALPRSRLHAVLLVVFWRLVLALRGFGYRERLPSDVHRGAQIRIDAISSLGTGLGLSVPILAWLFNTHALLLALRAGDPDRIAYPIASEVAHSASGGGKTWRRTQRLIDIGEAIAKRCKSPKAAAWMLSVGGFAHYARGDYRRAYDVLARAEAVVRSCGGKGYEISSTQFFLTNTLAALGELKEFSARVPELLREARERDDLFAAVHFRTGFSNLAWLVGDRPTEARRHLHEAMASWSTQGFHVAHFYGVLAAANIALYTGDADDAVRQVQASLPAYTRSFLSQVQTVRIRMRQLQARCALAAAARGRDREQNVRLAERMARRIASERMPWSDPMAALLLAAIARLRGDEARAVRGLREALAGFEAQGLQLDAAVTAYVLGKAIGGEEGQARMDGALAWMNEQTVKSPERFIAMVAPGL